MNKIQLLKIIFIQEENLIKKKKSAFLYVSNLKRGKNMTKFSILPSMLKNEFSIFFFFFLLKPQIYKRVHV